MGAFRPARADRAARRPHDAHDAFHQRCSCRCRCVPSSATVSPALTRGKPPAVRSPRRIRIDPADRQFKRQGRPFAPRHAHMDSGVPSQMMRRRPGRSRAARTSINRLHDLCSIMMMVMPAPSPEQDLQHFAHSVEDSPAIASSESSSRGRAAIARASSILRIPPAKDARQRASLVGQPMPRSSSSPRHGCPALRRDAVRHVSSGTGGFPATDMVRKAARIWKLRAIPAARALGRPAAGEVLSVEQDLPASFLRLRHAVDPIVVLPNRWGDQPEALAGGDLAAHLRRARRSRRRLRHALDLQHAVTAFSPAQLSSLGHYPLRGRHHEHHQQHADHHTRSSRRRSSRDHLLAVAEET